SAVRRTHSPQRVVLPVGFAAGQPQDRLGIRVAQLLLSWGCRRRGRQRDGEPGVHAACRTGPGRGHSAHDHARHPAHPGRARIINAGAVGVELAIVAVLVIVLLIAVAITGSGSVENLASRGIVAGDPAYFAIGGGVMLAMLMGLGTLVGFEAAANL